MRLFPTISGSVFARTIGACGSVPASNGSIPNINNASKNLQDLNPTSYIVDAGNLVIAGTACQRYQTQIKRVDPLDQVTLKGADCIKSTDPVHIPLRDLNRPKTIHFHKKYRILNKASS